MVEPLEHDHTQITLIDPGRSLDDLMSVALTNRPELASRQALVQAAEAAIRREKARPFIPNVVLNGFQTPIELLQAGIFGFGPNSSLNQWMGRDDFSVQPLWQLQNIGIGNLAMIKGQRGQQSQAIIELFRTQDMVAADVTRALARVQSAAVRVVLADRALRTGIITFNGNFEGLKQTSRFGDVLVLINRPQEAVYALQLLNWPSRNTSPRWPSTTGRSSSCSTRWATRPGRSPISGRPATSSRWTRPGRPTCPRSATGRPRQPDERQPSRGVASWDRR